MKEIEYWGLAAIVGNERKRKTKVILRKIGTGNVTFWSVMPELKKNKDTYDLAADDIVDG